MVSLEPKEEAIVTVVPALVSYVSGVSRVALLGDTIGDNFDRTVSRCADREALVDCPSGRRWCYAQLRRTSTPWHWAFGRRDREGRPGRHLGAEQPRVADSAVRHREDRRDPGDHQPGYRTHELTFVLNPGRSLPARVGEGVQDLELRGDDRRSAPAECTTLRSFLW